MVRFVLQTPIIAHDRHVNKDLTKLISVSGMGFNIVHPVQFQYSSYAVAAVGAVVILRNTHAVSRLYL